MKTAIESLDSEGCCLIRMEERTRRSLATTPAAVLGDPLLAASTNSRTSWAIDRWDNLDFSSPFPMIHRTMGNTLGSTFSLADASVEAHSSFSRAVLNDAFGTLHLQLERSRRVGEERRRTSAPAFSVFDFLDNDNENFLSDLLQFFLNPGASHGQGALFLKRLLKTIRPDLDIETEQVGVAREALTYSLPAAQSHRRIDLLVTTPRFVLGIENKKFSGEGINQIQDYCAHLANIAGQRDLCLVFLSHTGAAARSISQDAAAILKEKKRLICWSWERDIRFWLNDCLAQCGSPKVQHFIEDFLSYIGTRLA